MVDGKKKKPEPERRTLRRETPARNKPGKQYFEVTFTNTYKISFFAIGQESPWDVQPSGLNISLLRSIQYTCNVFFFMYG